jgi:hypothetical protein
MKKQLKRLLFGILSWAVFSVGNAAMACSQNIYGGWSCVTTSTSTAVVSSTVSTEGTQTYVVAGFEVGITYNCKRTEVIHTWEVRTVKYYDANWNQTGAISENGPVNESTRYTYFNRSYLHGESSSTNGCGG